MRILFYVSLCLLTNAASSAWAAKFPAFPLVCGTYVAEGLLSRNSRGDFVLRMGAPRSGYRELLLLGGGVKTKMGFLRSRVQTKVYVPQEIESESAAPYAFLLDLRKSKGKEQLKLVRRRPCGQSKP